MASKWYVPGRHCDATDLYYRDIQATKPLSRQREAELFSRVRQGDPEAGRELVTANLRFVVCVARQYTDRGLSLLELVSEGNLGLLDAVCRFDETRGYKFISYAVWWIRRAILTALAQEGRVAHLPARHLQGVGQVEKQVGRLAQELGHTPSHGEMVARIGVSAERLHRAQTRERGVSLDAPLRHCADKSLHAVLCADEDGIDERYEKEQLRQTVQASLQVLSERERKVLCGCFGLDGGEPKSLWELGEILGISRERVRQLRNEALGRLRKRRGRLLVEFADS